jgi:hypothetical protein
MISVRSWLALLLLFQSLARVTAATYYVDGQNTAASDTNPGTAQNPFKTISAAAKLAVPGTTVIVRSGTYREAVAVLNSGTPTAPIIFTAEKPGTVIVTGADPLTGWQKADHDAPIYSVPWTYVFSIDTSKDGKPIEHHPPFATLWGRAEQVIADQKQLLPCASLDELKKSWQARATPAAAEVPRPVAHLGGPFIGMFYVDTIDKKRLYLWLADGSDPNRHQVQASTRAQIFGINRWQSKNGIHDVQVHGFVFRYGATFPQRPAVSLFGKDNLVSDCVIDQMAGYGVGVNGTLRRCIVSGCGSVGGGATDQDFLNEDSVWEGNSWKPIDRGWEAAGFKMGNGSDGVFRRCLFRRNGGPGLWFDVDVRRILVSDCVFQENENSGAFIEISRDIQLVHNLALGNSIGVVGTAPPSFDVSGGITLAESINCLVASNTCVGNLHGISMREQGPRADQANDEYGNTNFHNVNDVIVGNVCALNNRFQLGIYWDNPYFSSDSNGMHAPDEETIQKYIHAPGGAPLVLDPTAAGLIFDRNIYQAAGQSVILYGAPWKNKHQVFSDTQAFTQATGFDSHSVVADPKFVDVAKGNYSFQPGSPAITMQAGWLTVPTDLAVWEQFRGPTWLH